MISKTLNIETPENIKLVSRNLDVISEQYIFKCPNGYGASVVKGWGTYGSKEGLWELAVIKFVNGVYKLDYTTPIARDVIGYLSEQEVLDHLIQISKLEKK